MDIGDYYSKSINGFTKNPNIAIPILIFNILIYGVTFIGTIIMVFAFLGPNFLSNGNISPYMANIPDMGTIALFSIVLLVACIVLFLIYSFVNAATIGMAKKIINGEKPELSVGLKAGKKYFVKIFVISIIMVILGVLTWIPLFIGLLVDRMYGLWPTLTIIGALITIIAYIALFFIFIFTYQSIVVGKKSVISSIKDSVKLIRKNLLEVLVVLIINAVILIGINALMFFVNMFLGIIPIVGAIISMILSIIVSSLTYPYFTLVLTYLYMDKKDKITSSNGYIE